MTKEQFLSIQEGQTIYMKKSGKPRVVTSVGNGAIQLDDKVTYGVWDKDLFTLEDEKKRDGGSGQAQS